MDGSYAEGADFGDLFLPWLPDVIVYTMGKVGSSSMSASLRAKRIKCFDVHILQASRIEKLLGAGIRDADRVAIAPNLIASTAALDAVMRRRRRGQVTKVITAIREPISRNISAVFQNMPPSVKDRPDEIARLVSTYTVLSPDAWFETDFQPTTGLNVLGGHHDREAGTFRFKNDLFDVLLLKVEIPDSEKEAAISDFLGKKVELLRANEAKDKWYNDVYAQHLRDAQNIGKDFAQRSFDLKYFHAFYSDAEIARVAARFGITASGPAH